MAAIPSLSPSPVSYKQPESLKKVDTKPYSLFKGFLLCLRKCDRSIRFSKYIKFEREIRNDPKFEKIVIYFHDNKFSYGLLQRKLFCYRQKPLFRPITHIPGLNNDQMLNYLKNSRIEYNRVTQTVTFSHVVHRSEIIKQNYLDVSEKYQVDIIQKLNQLFYRVTPHNGIRREGLIDEPNNTISIVERINNISDMKITIDSLGFPSFSANILKKKIVIEKIPGFFEIILHIKKDLSVFQVRRNEISEYCDIKVNPLSPPDVRDIILVENDQPISGKVQVKPKLASRVKLQRIDNYEITLHQEKEPIWQVKSLDRDIFYQSKADFPPSNILEYLRDYDLQVLIKENTPLLGMSLNGRLLPFFSVVHQPKKFISRIDSSSSISSLFWGVVLVNPIKTDLLNLDVLARLATTQGRIALAGVAKIIVEGVNRGAYFRKTYQFGSNNSNATGRITIIDETHIPPCSHSDRTRVFLRDVSDVQAMINHIELQRDHGTSLYDIQGGDYKLNIDDEKEADDKLVKANSITWARRQLARAKIFLNAPDDYTAESLMQNLFKSIIMTTLVFTQSPSYKGNERIYFCYVLTESMMHQINNPHLEPTVKRISIEKILQKKIKGKNWVIQKTHDWNVEEDGTVVNTKPPIIDIPCITLNVPPIQILINEEVGRCDLSREIKKSLESARR